MKRILLFLSILVSRQNVTRRASCSNPALQFVAVGSWGDDKHVNPQVCLCVRVCVLVCVCLCVCVRACVSHANPQLHVFRGWGGDGSALASLTTAGSVVSLLLCVRRSRLPSCVCFVHYFGAQIQPAAVRVRGGCGSGPARELRCFGRERDAAAAGCVARPASYWTSAKTFSFFCSFWRLGCVGWLDVTAVNIPHEMLQRWRARIAAHRVQVRLFPPKSNSASAPPVQIFRPHWKAHDFEINHILLIDVITIQHQIRTIVASQVLPVTVAAVR